MADVTNELLLEVLKQIQGRMNNLDDGLREVRQELLAIRGHMTAIQSDISNLYGGQAKIELRLEHIERRLDIAAEPAE